MNVAACHCERSAAISFWGIVAIALVLIVASVATAQYGGGTGEPNDPYQIATAADLIALGETPDDYDKHFILTADIDLDPNLPGGKIFDKAVISYLRMEPHVGALPRYFSGAFDGKGHTISHLTIVGTSSIGLFGRLASGADVKNTRIVDADVSGSRVACLAGVNDGGKITGCYSSGTVCGGNYAGGLIGQNYGNVAYCQSEGAVSGGDHVGGLIGSSYGDVTCCRSEGTVVGNEHVGGLIGNNGSWNSGGHDVVVCYSTATVAGLGYVGGLVGSNCNTLRRCYSAGSVSGTDYVGGLVGRNYISRGGSYSGYVWDSFWDMETTGQTTSGGGTGLTTAQMQSIGTFLAARWDFVDETENGTSQVWQMPQDAGYPVLAIFNGYTPPQLKGMGTEEDPYLIHDALELGAIIHYSPDAHYRLAAAIDLSGICWGMAVIPRFCGVFDGNDLTISNLTTEGDDKLGLFGQLESGGVVEHLGLTDVNIVSDSGWCVGGLLGRNVGTVIECYSTGVVTGYFYVGGLLGRNLGAVTASYSSAAVKGTFYVGGLVGQSDSGTMTQCCSRGSAGGGWYVGGLVGGNQSGVVTNSYSRCAVSGEESAGGLVGANSDGSVSASFWDIETSGQATSAGGIGKTTAEMQTASTFLEGGWDFVDETANGTEDIWWIDEGKDYPRLWWEPRPAVRLPVIELDATTFDAGIAEGVVLVDFFATWCSHCVTQAPILDEVADRLEGRAQVAKLDIDKVRSIAQQYGVTGVPTLVLFQDGVEVQRFVGVTGADVLVEAILAVADSI